MDGATAMYWQRDGDNDVTATTGGGSLVAAAAAAAVVVAALQNDGSVGRSLAAEQRWQPR